MAVSSNRALIQMRGHIGRLLVIRYYAQADRIVLSAFPDMKSVVFSKAQRDNQSKFKKAVEFASKVRSSEMVKPVFSALPDVEFASKVRSSEMLSFLFQQTLGNEISVYKEAVKQYFKNPDAPLSFLLDAKMQGSSKVCPRKVLPSCPNERLELAEKHLFNTTVPQQTNQSARPSRRNNPNFRKYPLLMQGKLAQIIR